MQVHVRLMYRFIFIILLLTTCLPSYAQTNDDILDFLPPMLVNIKSDDGDNGSAANLCVGYQVNDKANRPMTNLAKPAPMATYTDPVFGSKITRISNADAISSGIVRTLYSTVQSWNADESRLILWHRGDGHYLYDGRTYNQIERLNVVPSDIELIFWSTNDPDTFMYPNQAIGSFVPTSGGQYRLNGKELLEYNIATRLYRVIKDFSSMCSVSGGVTSGGDAQMPSYDGDVIGLRCGDLIFSYRLSTDIITELPEANLPSPQNNYAPIPFPSGERSYHYDTVRDENMRIDRTFNLGRPDEHASLGRLHNGNDGYFAVAFDATTDGSCNGGVGSLVINDATNGECRVLVGQNNGYPYTLSGTHVSALANLNPGWAVVSSIGYGVEGDSLLEQELYIANTDPNNPQVCRIAHHRSSGRFGGIGYFAEPHPVLSPSGTRVLFNSDWNNSGTVDTYVVELPSYESSN